MRLSRDQLLEDYEGYATPKDSWLVGGEFERHLLWPDGRPVAYSEKHGVRWILEQMVERGWSPTYEGDNPIALRRNGAWITLEPGGQLELSGAPHHRVREVMNEALHFAHELQEVLAPTPIVQAALGYTPIARIEDIEWVPKGRYVVMRKILGAAGTLAHHMMKGTASVQASFDFSDEEDCARKMRLSTLLGPMTTAMYANSPLTEGRPNGWSSFRGHIWTQTDPARTGFPEAAHHFTFERWVDYLLDVPMMFTKIDGAWADAGGRSFRSWMATGINGIFPTHEDWDLHLTSVFPEVRVKKQIEVRGADCVPIVMAASFVTLFKGLFYCARAQNEAMVVAERFASNGTREERFDAACRHGLAGEVGGRRLSDWTAELLDTARRGIERCDPADLPMLAPLIAQVDTGESPSAGVLRAWKEDPTPAAFVERFKCVV